MVRSLLTLVSVACLCCPPVFGQGFTNPGNCCALAIASTSDAQFLSIPSTRKKNQIIKIAENAENNDTKIGEQLELKQKQLEKVAKKYYERSDRKPTSKDDATDGQVEDPVALQRKAIGRIESFIAFFRKTGDFTSRRGDLDEAERILINTLTPFEARNDYSSLALSLINLGKSQTSQGKWNNSLEYYKRAETAARQAGHPTYQSKALMQQANAESTLGELHRAQEHVDHAIEIAVPLEDKTSLFDALLIETQIYLKKGNHNAAMASINRALLLPAITPDRLFYAYSDRGGIYIALSEKCDNQPLFEMCFQAIELARKDYVKAREIALSLGWSGLAKMMTDEGIKYTEDRQKLIGWQKHIPQFVEEKGERLFHPKNPSDVVVTERFGYESSTLSPPNSSLSQETKELERLPAKIPEEYEKLERLREKAGGFALVDSNSLLLKGRMLRYKGNRAEALSFFLKGVETLEQERGKLQDDAARGSFLEDKMSVYYEAIKELLDQGRQGEAFDLMERSRSRTMADLLASRQLNMENPREQQLYAESLSLRTALGAQQKKLFRMVSSGSPAGELEPIHREIAALEEAERKLGERISKDAPRLLQLTASRMVSLETLQEQMRQEDFEVLEYLVTDTALILWHINANSVKVLNVLLPGPQLRAKSQALQASVADKNDPFDQQSARELYLFLIQPVVDRIRSQRLVIIPHDVLHLIPFQVLENPADGSSLGEKYQLSYAPSATIFSSLRKSGLDEKANLLAIADPSMEDTEKEVTNIAKLFPGRHKVILEPLAEESYIKAKVGDYDVVHLSVHGVFDGREPMLSYLKLASGAQDDGRLTAGEMFGLPLGKTNLVVLSACESGKYETTNANEALGMLRGLLYAGANTVVLSYWKVDSAATALWMETFYKVLQSSNPAEAARQALRAVKNRKEYSHPNFWGAFMLVSR